MIIVAVYWTLLKKYQENIFFKNNLKFYWTLEQLLGWLTRRSKWNLVFGDLWREEKWFWKNHDTLYRIGSVHSINHSTQDLWLLMLGYDVVMELASHLPIQSMFSKVVRCTIFCCCHCMFGVCVCVVLGEGVENIKLCHHGNHIIPFFHRLYVRPWILWQWHLG